VVANQRVFLIWVCTKTGTISVLERLVKRHGGAEDEEERDEQGACNQRHDEQGRVKGSS